MDLALEDLTRRALRLRLVVADCDGVLTDSGVYYSERGEELKRFSARDGVGFERLREAGLSIAIITTDTSPSTLRRAEKLRARALVGVKDKAAYLERVLEEMQLTAGETAYIGDDVDDVAVMEAIAPHGLVGAPADAMPEALRAAHHVTESPGGYGALRDFAEWIVRLRSGATGAV
jgi:3-deoxy-D-manno-octulosonate 8-phosphate phosphatase (KDO 8-P phosphatase)